MVLFVKRSFWSIILLYSLLFFSFVSVFADDEVHILDPEQHIQYDANGKVIGIDMTKSSRLTKCNPCNDLSVMYHGPDNRLADLIEAWLKENNLDIEPKNGHTIKIGYYVCNPKSGVEDAAKRFCETVANMKGVPASINYAPPGHIVWGTTWTIDKAMYDFLQEIRCKYGPKFYDDLKPRVGYPWGDPIHTGHYVYKPTAVPGAGSITESIECLCKSISKVKLPKLPPVLREIYKIVK